jgi:hypothetical protein
MTLTILARGEEPVKPRRGPRPRSGNTGQPLAGPWRPGP